MDSNRIFAKRRSIISNGHLQKLREKIKQKDHLENSYSADKWALLTAIDEYCS